MPLLVLITLTISMLIPNITFTPVFYLVWRGETDFSFSKSRLMDGQTDNYLHKCFLPTVVQRGFSLLVLANSKNTEIWKRKPFNRINSVANPLLSFKWGTLSQWTLRLRHFFKRPAVHSQGTHRCLRDRGYQRNLILRVLSVIMRFWEC